MTLITRTIIILTLMLGLAGRMLAQATTETTTTETSTAAPAATTTAETTRAESGEGRTTSYEIRNQFTALLRNFPPDLATIFKLDPSLLSNDTYVGGYPELAEFLAKHPEIRRNPRFYLADFPYPGTNSSVLDDIVEMILVTSGFVLAVFAFGWLIRTIVEQKRWSRLSRTQAEVHNKILDRFGSSDELLQYIKTPAGTKFLESAPIPLHEERPAQNAPLPRIMKSIQLGVIVAVAALGMLLVSLRFDGETGEGLFALGAIAFTVGAGFIASAVVSMKLSRRLGLLREADAAAAIDESASMR